MNERGIIIPALLGILIAAIVVGAAIYGTQQAEPETTTAPPNPEAANPPPAEPPRSDLANFNGTAAALLAEGQNITCSVSRTDAAGTVAGTTFVAGRGNRLRGDFVLTRPDGVKVNGHIILAGGNSYFWADELPQGVKRPLPADPAAPAGGSEQNVFDQSLQYTCQPWTVDATVFALPGNKEFIDFTQF
jgi:hypothetical protein